MMLTRTHKGTFEGPDKGIRNIPECLKTAFKATGSRRKSYRGGFITWCLSMYTFGAAKRTLKALRNVLALVDFYLRPLRVFDLLVLGYRSVGKTTFALKWKSRGRSFYLPTLTGVHGVNQIPLKTNHGKMLFNAWDVQYWSANDILSEDGDASRVYQGVKSLLELADCAIIMYDVTSRMSYKCLTDWYRGLTGLAGRIPIVVVGNKIDKNRGCHFITLKKMLPFYMKTLVHDTSRGAPPTQFFEISAKANINCDGPLLYLARLLTHKQLDDKHDKSKNPELDLIRQTPTEVAGSQLPALGEAAHAFAWLSDDDDL